MNCTQEKFLEIDNAYKAERVEIERKYFLLKEEVWKRRSAIISGGADVEAKVQVEEGDGTLHLTVFECILVSNSVD